MRYYSYFPGCSSSDGGAVANGLSAQAISKVLDMELLELEDWNCCGATPYGSLNELESACVAGRNLALAEKTGLDLVTPCSACYTTLQKVNITLKEHPDFKHKVDEALAAGGLEYKGKVRVRHLAEVLFSDIGPRAIGDKVRRKLVGLKVASYYGCQLVRPKYGFDDPEFPSSMDQLVECLGAESVPFPLKTRCCGGALIISETDLVLELVHKILESARENGAQLIITPCPLCQTNLDVYQAMVNRKFKTNYQLPVLFLTQLIGVAFAVDSKALGLDKNMVSPLKALGAYL
jgi:heterodisulfide reductase subunit B